MAEITANDDQGSARAHRRRHVRLQEGAHRGRRRHGEGDRVPAQEGARRRRQEGGPHRHRGRGHLVHPQRPRRRAARGQLRDRLRRQDRGLQALPQGRGDAHRRRVTGAALRLRRRGRSDGDGQGARDPARPRRSSRARRPRSSARSSTARSPSGRRTSACSTRSGCAIPKARRPSARCSPSSSPSSARTSRSAASSRWELGEGLEKKKDDFAAEVAKQAGL